MTVALEINAAGHTDVGRLRDHNEDAYVVRPGLLAVADGLGGHAAGEVASAIAIDTLAGLAQETISDPAAAGKALRQTVEEANRAIRAAARDAPERAGMGTTATVALLVADTCCLGHVGDSRAYLLREGTELRQLTDDHSHVADLVRSGELTAAEARVHPQRAMITRALGLDDAVEVDVPEPVALAAGDRLLLCSDGLTEPLDDPQITELLAAAEDAQSACGLLVDAANAAGGPDNITVCVAFVGSG